MPLDFSDPLTSVAYASTKTDSQVDPLTAPPPQQSTRTQTSGGTNGTNATSTIRLNATVPTHNNPLSTSSSPSFHGQHTKSNLVLSSLTRQQKNTLTEAPRRVNLSNPHSNPSSSSKLNFYASETAASVDSIHRFSENQATSPSMPSSPKSTIFSDPLHHSSSSPDQTFNPAYSGPKTPQMRSQPQAKRALHTGSYYQSSGASNSTTNNRATNAAYPSSGSPTGAIPSVSPHVSTPQTKSTTLRNTRRDSQYDAQRVKAPQYLHITIPDTSRRAKDGMFVLSVQTNMPRFKKHSYNNITRSYLEFARLREHLVEEHPEAIVPVLPPERSLISTNDIQSMRLFLERVSKHPVLVQDYELQIFIESEFGFLPPAKPTKILGKLLNIGTKRFSSGASSTLSSGDTDDEFEEERSSAVKVEVKLQTVIKNLDKEIKARRDFSSKELELSTFCNAWAAEESLPELARTFKMLAKPLDGIAKASKAQVGGDATVLGSFLEYKLQHVQTMSNALDYRLSVLGEYDAAVKSTESKRKTMERLRSSTNINPEKVTDSIDDLEDAVLFEGNMKMRMEQVSSALVNDLEVYRLQSQEDLLRCLRQYSQRQIGFEKAKLEELMSVAVGAKVDVDSEERRHDNEHAR